VIIKLIAKINRMLSNKDSIEEVVKVMRERVEELQDRCKEVVSPEVIEKENWYPEIRKTILSESTAQRMAIKSEFMEELSMEMGETRREV
jgi:hypothetical protein